MNDAFAADVATQLDDYVLELEQIVAQGGVSSPGLEAVVSAWRCLGQKPTGAAQRLQEACVSGRPVAEIEALKTPAIVESIAQETPRAMPKLRAALVRPMTTAIAAAYGEVALKNYNAIADKFDAAARDFAECCEQVDVETDSSQVIRDAAADKSPKARAAFEPWVAAELHAATLNALLPELARAARYSQKLSDKQMVVEGADAKPIDWWLTLVIGNPADVQIRDLWAAWDTKGRTGRWGALIAAGARLEALRELEGFSAQRRPEAIKTEYLRTGRGVWTPVQTDPEAVTA